MSGESDDESAIKAVIEDVYKCTDSRYQAKVASYLAAGDENAAQTARDDMRPLYKRVMREVLKQYLVFGIEIKRSEHYKKLMKDIYHYKDEKGYEIKTAVKKALLKNGCWKKCWKMSAVATLMMVKTMAAMLMKVENKSGGDVRSTVCDNDDSDDTDIKLRQ